MARTPSSSAPAPDTLAPVPVPPSPGVAASQGETTPAAEGSGPPAAGGAFVYRVALNVPHSTDNTSPLFVVYPERLFTPAEISVVRQVYNKHRPGNNHVQILDEIPAAQAPDPVLEGRELYEDLVSRYTTKAGRDAIERVFPHREVGNYDVPKRVL